MIRNIESTWRNWLVNKSQHSVNIYLSRTVQCVPFSEILWKMTEVRFVKNSKCQFHFINPKSHLTNPNYCFLRKMKTTPSEKYEIRGKNWDLNDFQSRVWNPGPIWSAPVREKPFAKIMTGQQVLTIPGRLASFVLVKHWLIQKISGLIFQALG